MRVPHPYRTTLEPRSSQRRILDMIFGEKSGDRKIYISSPPGSGKTIVGLMAAARMQVPSLVLAPTTAIQGQWIDKARLFVSDDSHPFASIDPLDRAPVTVLTYQSLARGNDMGADERIAIIADWRRELLEEGCGEVEAESWLRDFEENNPERFNLSLLRRWRRKRERSDVSSSVVCEEASGTMDLLRESGVGLVIFDECHHLAGYWAQVAIELERRLGAPRLIGLTATPPSPEDLQDWELSLHQELLGEPDYRLHSPAFVRDGALAPYQDLVFFTRPTAPELDYIRSCSKTLAEVLALVENHGGTTLSAWLLAELKEIPEKSFAGALRRRAAFISAAVRQLKKLSRPVPRGLANFADGQPSLEEEADLVGRYAASCLLVSGRESDRQLYGRLSNAFRPLGYVLTEKGLRNCQSTVGRILAMSNSKMDAVVGILESEMESMGGMLRALVVTDFERSSAMSGKDLSEMLSEEAGGAIAVLRTLTSNPSVDALDPVLVTGQSLMVDDDLLPRFLEEARNWFAERGISAEISSSPDGGFFRIRGSGREWNTRNYVAMSTSLFERGVTRCLVGTRGLLGEGWDSLTANTLIDLSAAATETSVNQLRGRAIRLDPGWPEKTSNIWDIVCMAPEFEKGLSDYARFSRKHSNYYGICDDGAIEYGLGHIHPALTGAGPEDVALNAAVFNAEMLERSRSRKTARENWRIGEAYENRHMKAVEIKADSSLDNEFVAGGLRLGGAEMGVSGRLKLISQAVFEALADGGIFESSGAKLEISRRADDYFRICMDGASERDISAFSESLDELFRPVDEQRYMIPRWERIRKDNWFSKMMPEIVRRFVQTREDRIAVYHPLPSRLSSSKTLAEIFSDRWNLHVSPGRAIFTKRGDGEQVLASARSSGQSIQSARAKIKSLWR